MKYSFVESNGYYIIEFEDRVRTISSAPFNGGVKKSIRYVNRNVPISYDSDPAVEIAAFLNGLGINGDGTVVTMTAVDISTYYRERRSIGSREMEIFITAGFENATSMGNRNSLYGTINVCLVTDLPLSDSAGINMLQSIVEAKSQFMNDFGVIDQKTGIIAPGTSTDTVSIFILSEDRGIKYAGRITEPGYHASMMTYNGLLNIATSTYKLKPNQRDAPGL